MKKENLITIEEFAILAGVSHQAIYDLMLKGRLPHIKVLGKRAIDVNNGEVKEYLQKRGIKI